MVKSRSIHMITYEEQSFVWNKNQLLNSRAWIHEAEMHQYWYWY